MKSKHLIMGFSPISKVVLTVSARETFQRFFLYADGLIKNRLVGGELHPLLEVIPNPGEKNKNGKLSYTYQPTTPLYTQCVDSEIRYIGIEITDDNGDPITFDFGSSGVILHFRKIKHL